MALIFADRVQETTTTAGTGPLSLAGAVINFQTFGSVLSNTDTTYYAIVDDINAQWEVGLGTYVVASNTLQRTTVLASSNNNLVVNLTGTGGKRVFITTPAEIAGAASTGIQPGDNVSLLTNDANYTSTGDNVSLFANDANYTSTGDNVSLFANDANYTSVGDNVSIFTNDAGYLTAETDTLDSVTSRGATTTNSVAVGNFTSTGIDDNASATALTLSSAGNVGIGTTAPAAAFSGQSLDASGPIIARGAIAAAQTNAGVLQYNANDLVFRSYGATAGSGAIAFRTGGGGGTADAEAMRLTNSGNVGIGTANPSGRRLRVEGATNAESSIALVNSTPNGTVTLRFGDSATDTAGYIQYQNADDDLLFGVNGSELMRITSSGSLSIGHTAGVAPLDILTDKTNATPSVANSAFTIRNLNTKRLVFGEQATSPFGTWIQATNTLENTYYPILLNPLGGNVGIGTSSPNARLTVCEATGLTGLEVYPQDSNSRVLLQSYERGQSAYRVLDFSALYYRFFTGGSESMRIDTNGNLLVGTTSRVFTEKATIRQSDTGAYTAVFQNTSATPNGIAIDYSGASPNNTGAVFLIGFDTGGEEFRINSAGAFVQASDRRIKSNIVSAQSAGHIIDGIKVREYDKGLENPQHWSHGFIAQELYDVYPEAVHKPENEEDTWGVEYSRLVPLMVKEIQELRARVAQLEANNGN